MAANTALNESLACIALGYVTYKEDHSLEDFHKMITQTSGNLWNRVISRCELSDTKVSSYREAYPDKKGSINPWISTSYKTAVQIIKSLKLNNLKDYKFAKVEKDRNNRAYLLKQRATSAIKIYSKEVMSKPGILATLNADKVNIGDIMIIKNNSKIFNTIKELVENTDIAASKLKKAILENQKEFLTMERYRNLMVEAWKENEIYSVSLKQLDEKSENIPVKISNLPSSLSRTVKEREQDEFAAYISYLIRITKDNGTNYKAFEDAVNEFVDIKPVVFTAQDRLLVYFDLKYEGKTSGSKIKKEYHIFTNFGTGNAIHFVPKGSKSASGEGGITVNYFYTLVKNFPKLKVFFQELAYARIFHFEKACKENKLNSQQINKDLGQNSMYSGKYNSSLYLAKNYEDLANRMFNGKNAYGYLSQNNAELTANIQAFSEFFDSYTAYLSKTPGSMGKFLGIAKKSKIAINGKISKIKKDIENEIKKKGSLTKEEKIKVLDKYKTPFITEYKKSYALLCNAEFGFFFAKHQADLEEILKKQVLLSFYAAASGRGYIIFDGKKFSEDDIYEKNVAPPPFLKVGM